MTSNPKYHTRNGDHAAQFAYQRSDDPTHGYRIYVRSNGSGPGKLIADGMAQFVAQTLTAALNHHVKRRATKAHGSFDQTVAYIIAALDEEVEPEPEPVEICPPAETPVELIEAYLRGDIDIIEGGQPELPSPSDLAAKALHDSGWRFSHANSSGSHWSRPGRMHSTGATLYVDGTCQVWTDSEPGIPPGEYTAQALIRAILSTAGVTF